MNITSLDLTIIALPIAILLIALFSRTPRRRVASSGKEQFYPCAA